MTASASAVELPERLTLTSRPVLVIGTVLSIALVGGAVLMWVQMGPLARSQWNLPQILTLAFFLAVIVVGMMGVGLSRVTVGPEGVTVRNAFRTHHFDWNQVDDFTMSSGDPWVYLKLADTEEQEGESHMVLAVQRAEGEACDDHLAQLRAYARHYAGGHIRG